MGRHHHLPVGPDVVAWNPADTGRVVCHDRPMAVRAAPAVPERRSRARAACAPHDVVPPAVPHLRGRGRNRRRGVGAGADHGVGADGARRAGGDPGRVRRDTGALPRLSPASAGAAGDLDGGDAPGRPTRAGSADRRRPAGDEEVVALAEAFNEMLDRLEGERRDSGRRALAAQEAERRRIARELHDEIGQLLTGLILRGETLGTARSRGPPRRTSSGSARVRERRRRRSG